MLKEIKFIQQDFLLVNACWLRPMTLRCFRCFSSNSQNVRCLPAQHNLWGQMCPISSRQTSMLGQRDTGLAATATPPASASASAPLFLTHSQHSAPPPLLATNAVAKPRRCSSARGEARSCLTEVKPSRPPPHTNLLPPAAAESSHSLPTGALLPPSLPPPQAPLPAPPYLRVALHQAPDALPLHLPLGPLPLLALQPQPPGAPAVLLLPALEAAHRLQGRRLLTAIPAAAARPTHAPRSPAWDAHSRPGRGSSPVECVTAAPLGEGPARPGTARHGTARHDAAAGGAARRLGLPALRVGGSWAPGSRAVG